MIHTSYTVGITTGEYKALQSVIANQQDWIENAIKNRARIASIEIQTNYSNYKIERGEAITAIGSTAIIEAAYAEGVVGIAPAILVDTHFGRLPRRELETLGFLEGELADIVGDILDFADGERMGHGFAPCWCCKANAWGGGWFRGDWEAGCGKLDQA